MQHLARFFADLEPVFIKPAKRNLIDAIKTSPEYMNAYLFLPNTEFIEIDYEEDRSFWIKLDENHYGHLTETQEVYQIIDKNSLSIQSILISEFGEIESMAMYKRGINQVTRVIPIDPVVFR